MALIREWFRRFVVWLDYVGTPMNDHDCTGYRCPECQL